MPIARVRITSKGQITLPIALRRKLGLDVGDEVVFEFGSGDGAVVVPLRRRKVSELSGALAGIRGPVALQQLRRIAYRRRAGVLRGPR